MRILHIGNTAGVASTIAKWQNKILKWKTIVITRKALDKFKLTTYGYALPLDKISYTILALILSFKYDIIHIHDYDKIIPIMRKIPIIKKKTIILHYHGTVIRGKWNKKSKYWRKADIVLVSTPDLLDGAPPKAIYLPNPVDTDQFRPMVTIKKKNFAIYMKWGYPNESLEWPKNVAKKYGLKLYIHDRLRRPVSHKSLPKLLNLFEYFIDRHFIKSLSKTALEALACGLKVIRWDERIIKKLPKIHEPTYTVKKLQAIYLKTLR